MNKKPTCFVIMPFGVKKYKVKGSRQEEWIDIDFDKVYKFVISPGIIGAGMDPIRADEEKLQGSIHKPMFERIILSDYVLADLTGSNANVFYEIGIRHAVKPYTTISIFANNSELPFDLAPFKAIPYGFSVNDGLTNIEEIKKQITTRLSESKLLKTTDSPVYQLVDGIHFQNSVAHEKTDIFRDRVIYNEELKNALEDARNTDGKMEDKVHAVENFIDSYLTPIVDQEVAILIDVMLSYRDISAFKSMEQFIERLPRHIMETVMVQEQYAFALNRNKKNQKAIKVLQKVIDEHRDSSETYGILGRIYKDFVEEKYSKGDFEAALDGVDDALKAYRKGFEADWRDAYPGINYVTCLEFSNDGETIKKIVPVVEYAVIRKKERKGATYWDDATLAELAVIANDYPKARKYLVSAKNKNPVDWMLDSTKKNFTMIKDFRVFRGEGVNDIDELINLLNKA